MCWYTLRTSRDMFGYSPRCSIQHRNRCMKGTSSCHSCFDTCQWNSLCRMMRLLGYRFPVDTKNRWLCWQGQRIHWRIQCMLSQRAWWRRCIGQWRKIDKIQRKMSSYTSLQGMPGNLSCFRMQNIQVCNSGTRSTRLRQSTDHFHSRRVLQVACSDQMAPRQSMKAHMRRAGAGCLRHRGRSRQQRPLSPSVRG